MRNLEFEIKRGASGAVITPTLSDANGLFDLTGFTSVTMTAKKGTTTVLDVEMDIDADQVTNKGQVSYEFDADTSDIVPDTYNLEIVATDAAGDLHKWPTDKRAPFGKLIVLPTN